LELRVNKIRTWLVGAMRPLSEMGFGDGLEEYVETPRRPKCG